MSLLGLDYVIHTLVLDWYGEQEGYSQMGPSSVRLSKAHDPVVPKDAHS